MLIHLRALEDINNELQSLSDRSSVTGYQENETDAHAVCEVAESLRDTILEYQVSTNIKILCSSEIFTEVPRSSLNRKHCTSRTVN